MITESELLALLGDLESFRVERTVSTKDTEKFSEAVCAFANDFGRLATARLFATWSRRQVGSPV